MTTPIQDCGASNCLCAPDLSGMRHNGGCRCFRDAPPAVRQAAMRAVRYWRAEVERLQKLETDSDRWGQVAVVLVNHGWRLQSEDEDVPAAVDRWLSGMGGE